MMARQPAVRVAGERRDMSFISPTTSKLNGACVRSPTNRQAQYQKAHTLWQCYNQAISRMARSRLRRMRKVATLPKLMEGVQRCILYACPEGVYVFPCATLEDGSGRGDYWFEDVASAEDFCAERYGVAASDWVEIGDPLPGCQHDWIANVRMKQEADGSPVWGQLERLDDDGVWRTITPK